ncbi:hypothetical protein BEWA_033580 [Theileria equi strain WA]|uniref:Uncharacterized protein n=1 Tax=Theileria equi strain WA TaxID=1537102 RepID=L0AZ35_THEEQ|nr:hypothetical protein BEWA_033580 [Theileria equi strain WA]AFZ80503.1 hypothetical protein BEWA_033580 [Theileria equi strain WA]|eukprot:XP_004830169.1 hypothetical protein BEWA_033580 [Theileria equi strain WA]
MEQRPTTSDTYLMDRLFVRAFSEYWKLLFDDGDLSQYKTIEPELQDVYTIGIHYKASHTGFYNKDDAHSIYPKDIEHVREKDTFHNSLLTKIEDERFKKLRITAELQEAFELLAICCESLNLISPNELIDDIHTENIKYLMLPYLISHVLMEKPDINNRFFVLRRVQVYLNQFINKFSRLEIAGSKGSNTEYTEKRQYGTGTERSEKIQRAIYERDLLKSIKTILASFSSVDEFFENATSHITDKEETVRAILIDFLKLFHLYSINHLESIKMELPFTEMREKNKITPHTHETEDNKTKPWFLHIDANSKIDPSVIQILYKHMVFLPGHNLPTISLDECARIEMEMDVKTIGKDEVCIKRKESGESLIDKAEVNDSDDESVCTEDEAKWSDWKDDHPKGSGNKLANIG